MQDRVRLLALVLGLFLLGQYIADASFNRSFTPSPFNLVGITKFEPLTAGGTDVGSAALPFGSAWIGGAATNNIKVTGTATAARVLTLPDVTGTVYTTATGSITSAQLLASLSDEIGSGAAVFANTPTLVTPNIGAATGSSLNVGSGAITSGTINGQTISAAANFTGSLTTAGAITAQSGNYQTTGGLLLGADLGAATLTNATRKAGIVATPHYTNAEEKVLALWMDADSGTNILRLGGGLSDFNAATSVQIVTGATNTTITGTTAATFDASQNTTLAGTLAVSGTGKSINVVSDRAILSSVYDGSNGYTGPRAALGFNNGASRHSIQNNAGGGMIIMAETADPIVIGVGNLEGLRVSTSNVLQFASVAEPTCNAANRGSVVYVAGGAGVLDTFRICRKDAADVYAYATLF